MALPYLGTRSYRANHLNTKGKYLGFGSNKALHQMGRGRPNAKGGRTSHVALHQEHIVYSFGIPKVILSNNGTPFVNKHVEPLVISHDITDHRSTPSFPKGNG